MIAPPPPPPPQPDKPWDVAPLSDGDWHYQQDAAKPFAWFGTSPANVALTLTCTKAVRRLALSRSGAAGGPGTMTVRTSFGDLAWPATPGTGAFPEMVATRGASDTGFDWIAFSRGRIAVEVAGLPRLVAPAWADVSRVIEDCRG